MGQAKAREGSTEDGDRRTQSALPAVRVPDCKIRLRSFAARCVRALQSSRLAEGPEGAGTPRCNTCRGSVTSASANPDNQGFLREKPAQVAQ